MMKPKILCTSIFLACIFLINACESNPEQQSSAQTASSSVISLDDVRVSMPELEGYDEFEAACITCHSLRYIEMQPDFPKKTWENIVSKMVKNFGAPIPDSTAAKIVEYLATVKGK